MATLTRQAIAASGTAITHAVPSATTMGADKCPPGDHTFVWVKNGSGSSITFKVNDPNSVAPAGSVGFDPDISVTIAAGAEKLVGPLPATRFADPSDGLVQLQSSATTSIGIACVTT